MQEILQKFEAVLNEQDLMFVPQGVEELIKLYVHRHSSEAMRKAIAGLLERKAAESTSRALTAYLRAAAKCVKDFAKVADDGEAKMVPRPPLKAMDETDPRNPTALGSYLQQLRSETA
jgi:hypothetical protein